MLSSTTKGNSGWRSSPVSAEPTSTTQRATQASAARPFRRGFPPLRSSTMDDWSWHPTTRKSTSTPPMAASPPPSLNPTASSLTWSKPTTPRCSLERPGARFTTMKSTRGRPAASGSATPSKPPCSKPTTACTSPVQNRAKSPSSTRATSPSSRASRPQETSLLSCPNTPVSSLPLERFRAKRKFAISTLTAILTASTTSTMPSQTTPRRQRTAMTTGTVTIRTETSPMPFPTNRRSGPTAMVTVTATTSVVKTLTSSQATLTNGPMQTGTATVTTPTARTGTFTPRRQRSGRTPTETATATTQKGTNPTCVQPSTLFRASTGTVAPTAISTDIPTQMKTGPWKTELTLCPTTQPSGWTATATATAMLPTGSVQMHARGNLEPQPRPWKRIPTPPMDTLLCQGLAVWTRTVTGGPIARNPP